MSRPLRFGRPLDQALTTFPPEDISGFLQLNAGEWLTLRSLMAPEDAGGGAVAGGQAPETRDGGQPWHQSERGELRVTFLEPEDSESCGGLAMVLPGGSTVRLLFRADGTAWMQEHWGRWQLDVDGSLQLELEKDGRIIQERIWFSKPNLRLRCTLEQSLDGRPGRASFSSEIRRVSRSTEARETTLS